MSLGSRQSLVPQMLLCRHASQALHLLQAVTVDSVVLARACVCGSSSSTVAQQPWRAAVSWRAVACLRSCSLWACSSRARLTPSPPRSRIKRVRLARTAPSIPSRILGTPRARLHWLFVRRQPARPSEICGCIHDGYDVVMEQRWREGSALGVPRVSALSSRSSSSRVEPRPSSSAASSRCLCMIALYRRVQTFFMFLGECLCLLALGVLRTREHYSKCVVLSREVCRV